MRPFEIIVALIVGVLALFVLQVIGLVIKLAVIIALLVTVGAWVLIRAIGRQP
jgi:hypothetical protein